MSQQPWGPPPPYQPPYQPPHQQRSPAPHGYPQHGYPQHGYSPAPWSVPTPEPPPHPGLVVVTSLWRVVVGVVALSGLLLSHDYSGGWNLAHLSQLASLVAGGYFLALALTPLVRPGLTEGRDPFLRMSVLALLLVTMGVYLGFLGGDVDQGWSLLEHVVTPLLVLLDWVFVGRSQERTRVWHALALPAAPLLYLGFALVHGRDEPLYDVIDPHESGFVPFVAGALLGVVVLGFALLATGRLKAAVRSSLERGIPWPTGS